MRVKISQAGATLALVVALALGVSCGVANGAESFGVSSFGVSVSSSQAGAHPDLSTSFAFATDGSGDMIGQARNITVDLPVGLVGDPQAVPRCTAREFSQFDCQPSAQVGVLDSRFAIAGEAPFEEQTPVYNLAPSSGHTATLGTELSLVPILIELDVRRDGSYGIVATVKELSTLIPVQSSTLTVWGVPADPSHDAQRVGPAPGYATPVGAGVAPSPFVIDPSDCAAGPLESSLSVQSWQGQTSTQTASMPAVTGCETLGFEPALSVSPETTQAASPSGYAVDLRFPQNLEPYALATPDLRNAVVTLPAGTVVNPSAANGLGACSEEEIGLNTGSAVACPDSSKIGTVEIVSPALASPIMGSAYVARQGANPFGSLLAIYLAGEGEGVQVRLAGHVELGGQVGVTGLAPGQVRTTFDNDPQLPVGEVKLDLFGGVGAVLSNPVACGEARSTAQLTPWSASTPVEAVSAFTVTGCGGAGGFSPSFTAGTVGNQAGAYSPFTLTFSRTDGEQNLSGVTVETPKGLLADIASVPLCGEAEANAGTCPESSKIGSLIAAAGAGSEPLYLPQPGRREDPVYLTGPYNGGPFGLSIVTHAEAGPFNLGDVIVRASIRVNPTTAQVTVVSDPLPQIKDGIPFRLRLVNVDINRPNFTFNPTNCEELHVNSTITGLEGGVASPSNRFQVANCALLPFKPSFGVSTSAKTSKANGASLKVDLTYPQSGEANIHSVHVELPKSLPARLTTLQKACTEQEFNTNPATCPAASIVGHAKAITPILPVPLEGPAYFVSHGGAAFPELIMVLQGYGVTIQLNGETFINSKTDVTSSTFAHVPDAPVTSFELTLPEESNSALAANGNLCDQKLIMPTLIGGQNGAQIKQNTRIEVEGCGNSLSVVSTKVKKQTLTVSVAVPAAGKLTASGKGVTSETKTYSGQEAQTFTLTQKKAGKLKTKIKLTFTPSKGKKQTKSLTVRFTR